MVLLCQTNHQRLHSLQITSSCSFRCTLSEARQVESPRAPSSSSTASSLVIKRVSRAFHFWRCSASVLAQPAAASPLSPHGSESPVRAPAEPPSDSSRGLGPLPAVARSRGMPRPLRQGHPSSPPVVVSSPSALVSARWARSAASSAALAVSSVSAPVHSLAPLLPASPPPAVPESR